MHLPSVFTLPNIEIANSKAFTSQQVRNVDYEFQEKMKLKVDKLVTRAKQYGFYESDSSSSSEGESEMELDKNGNPTKEIQFQSTIE